MSSYENVYNSPEKHDLEIFGSFDNRDDLFYEFDMTVVFRDLRTGLFYVASDSGCSCPMPFEDYENKYDLDEPLTAERALAKVESIVNDRYDNKDAYRNSMSVRDRLRNIANGTK